MYSYTISLTSALDGVGGKRHAPAALPPGPVWTGAVNLAPTGIRSPAPPVRSESLSRPLTYGEGKDKDGNSKLGKRSHSQKLEYEA
jgi:hypothetical protein